jgi:hypothetical protein
MACDHMGFLNICSENGKILSFRRVAIDSSEAERTSSNFTTTYSEYDYSFKGKMSEIQPYHSATGPASQSVRLD